MKRYLVIDDDPPCCEVLVAVLAGYGACDAAEDGATAVTMVEQAVRAGTPYDLLCVEICLTGMNGHDCIQRIRELELPAQPQIFVVSKSSDVDDMSRALLNNDCDEYILKPFRKDALNGLLTKYKLTD